MDAARRDMVGRSRPMVCPLSTSNIACSDSICPGTGASFDTLPLPTTRLPQHTSLLCFRWHSAGGGLEVPDIKDLAGLRRAHQRSPLHSCMLHLRQTGRPRGAGPQSSWAFKEMIPGWLAPFCVPRVLSKKERRHAHSVSKVARKEYVDEKCGWILCNGRMTMTMGGEASAVKC